MTRGYNEQEIMRKITRSKMTFAIDDVSLRERFPAEIKRS